MNQPKNHTMSEKPNRLLSRLDAIGQALARSKDALALLALGSVGLETERLDAFSDLDFFVIVERGHKAAFISDLGWLACAEPLAWSFQNTVDGHKALMADGIFCEFAVFEAAELPAIPFSPGRIVWAREGIDPSLATPSKPLPGAGLPDEHWIAGEALSCLYVGLQRWHRGERLSAARFVQGHAVDRLIELDARRHPVPISAPLADRFNRERRLEARQPLLAAELPGLVPGYLHTPAAALAALAALQRRGLGSDCSAMVERIRELAQ
jgi:hypothetical protein